MYRYPVSKFITSVAPGFPLYGGEKPEIAVAGKSNVGKSSFINMLADNRKLAKTSATPGRTRLVNYFDFGLFTLVDLPGYGYAEVAKGEKEKWGDLLEGYLQTSGRIVRVILLLDSRHSPTEQDFMMLNYLYHYAIPFTVVLTKCDKLSRNQLAKSRAEIVQRIRLTENDIFCVSAETRSGREEIIQFLNAMVETAKCDRFDPDEEN